MNLNELSFGFIGLGNMGGAMVSGLLANGVPAANVRGTSKDPVHRQRAEQEFKIVMREENTSLALESDVIVLAVKPWDVEPVCREIAPAMDGGKLLIGVAAGVTLKQLEAGLEFSECGIIRAMPNLAASVREGMTVLAPNVYVEKEQLQIARSLFEGIGECIVLPEKHLDAVTALSGSGPGFVFLLIEAFVDAGVREGLPRDAARKLAIQTFLGSSLVAKQSEQHLAALKDMVTTPAGTTIAGLAELEAGAVRSSIMRAVTSATKRARKLSGGGRSPDRKKKLPFHS